MLIQTVRSFIEQNYDHNRFEIIIANNNSTDNTSEIIGRLVKESPIPIIPLLEKRQGAHFARNNAAKLAKGEILYFTDDDMIADQYLLSEIIRPFVNDDKVATVTGRVFPKWEVPPPQWILECCNNGLLSLNDPREDFIISPFDCNIFSCHQAIKRDVFFECGGYNPDIIGAEWVGDNEIGLNIKVREKGFKFAYNGKSIIYHMIPPSRMTQGYLNKRYANQGNCDSYTEYKKYRYSKAQLIRKIISHGIHYFYHAIKGVVRLVIMKPTYRLNWARTFYCINRIKYDYRLMNDEKWRQFVIRYNWINEEVKEE
jgi:glycosyltransferase involved in cell wall biosynthesis